jgi:hypothetical protein
MFVAEEAFRVFKIMNNAGYRGETKLGGGGTEDELAKPLIAVQQVKALPDQSRADRSVASLAIHWVTGGCEA